MLLDAKTILTMLELIRLRQVTAEEYAREFDLASLDERDVSKQFEDDAEIEQCVPNAHIITAEMFESIARWLRHPENHVQENS